MPASEPCSSDKDSWYMCLCYLPGLQHPANLCAHWAWKPTPRMPHRSIQQAHRPLPHVLESARTPVRLNEHGQKQKAPCVACRLAGSSH